MPHYFCRTLYISEVPYASDVSCQRFSLSRRVLKEKLVVAQPVRPVMVKEVKNGKGKGKAVPLQAWTGPEGSRKLGSQIL